MSTELSEDQRIALTRQLAELHDRNHTVADFGRAVLDFALTTTLCLPPSTDDAEAPPTCVEAYIKGGSANRLCAWIGNPAPVIEPRTIR